MGRTLPTATQLIEEFEATWSPYARALRKEDRALLKDLFAIIRLQSAPIAYMSSPEPFQAFTLAMLGGVLKRLVHLETILARYPDLHVEAAWDEDHVIEYDSPIMPEQLLLLPDRITP